MEIEYQWLGTQSQFFAIIRHLFVEGYLLYFPESHPLHYSARISSNFLRPTSSLSLFNANTIAYYPAHWLNSESRILDLIR